MTTMRLMLAILMLVPAVHVTSVATAQNTPGVFDEVIYEFNDDLYHPGSPAVLADLGIGPAKIIELRWNDIIIETYNNVGIPNWAAEAWMGVRAVDANGLPVDHMVQPFPNNYDDGIVGPTSGTLDVSVLDLVTNDDGLIRLLLASGWNDGSGEPAGSFLSGQLIVRYEQLVPAPGALALIGLTCLSPRRRRRR